MTSIGATVGGTGSGERRSGKRTIGTRTNGQRKSGKRTKAQAKVMEKAPDGGRIGITRIGARVVEVAEDLRQQQLPVSGAA
eukprot:10087963-Karenia_brevis.AAC.1